ncbi:MAG: nicotinamide-nucleotide amidohydrolase family protein [Pseudolabrys sp.]|nr:nicotinamide-nucleotide amidohydrolase family protein [Pseudolabrys sp.]
MTIETLAENVLRQAMSCDLTIAVAESCTAGALAAALSKAPGAGSHFHGGAVTYTKQAKHAVLGVSMDLLTEKSAVCAEVAEALAAGALRLYRADIAAAITGVAGPEPDADGNPVGLVYCAAARRGAAVQPAVVRIAPSADPPDAIIARALGEALGLLRQLCVR